jgi:hypothetical protein
MMEGAMNPIGRMCGVEVVFGGRWDDLRGRARLKATDNGVIGYYDEVGLSTSLVPAPIVAQRSAKADDAGAAQAIFYNDEEGKIFGSVILSGGQIAPLSETVFEDGEAWITAIARALRDPNLDIIHIPEGVQTPKVEKLRVYDLNLPVERKGLSRLSSTSNSKGLIGILLILMTLIGIGAGTWAYLTDQFAPPPPEIRMVNEKRIPLFGEILMSCAEDLSSPWPAPPEWELVREGCVADSRTAQLSGLAPAGQEAHAYRLYEINPQVWDPYLSRLAFLRISQRFPGMVIEGTNQFLLYLPYELQTRVVDNAYLPDQNPADLVRSRFVGSIEIQGGSGMEALSASSPLEIGEVLRRLSEERLTTGHVFHDLRSQRTGFRFGPERVETRQVRAD